MAKRKIFVTAEEIARTIVDNGLTVKQAADRFGCGRSSIQNYVNTLAETNPELYAQVKAMYKRNNSTKPATICESGEYVLTVTEKSEAPATGHRIGGNAHPIMDLTTGDIYTSGHDAAEKIGVTQASISWAVTGKSTSCKGHKFIKVADARNNISAISKAIKTANAKAEATQTEADIQIEAIRAECAENLTAAKRVANDLYDSLQTTAEELRETESKYNALAEKLAALATLDSEIAELEQRLAEAKANREEVIKNLTKKGGVK